MPVLDWDKYIWAYMTERDICHLVMREDEHPSGICGREPRWGNQDRWRVASSGMSQCQRCVEVVIRLEHENAGETHGYGFAQQSPPTFAESEVGRHSESSSKSDESSSSRKAITRGITGDSRGSRKQRERKETTKSDVDRIKDCRLRNSSSRRFCDSRGCIRHVH